MQKKDEQNLWYVLHDINLLKHKKVLYRNQKILIRQKSVNIDYENLIRQNIYLNLYLFVFLLFYLEQHLIQNLSKKYYLLE